MRAEPLSTEGRARDERVDPDDLLRRRCSSASTPVMIFVVEAIGRRWCERFAHRMAPVSLTKIAAGAVIGRMAGLLQPRRPRQKEASPGGERRARSDLLLGGGGAEAARGPAQRRASASARPGVRAARLAVGEGPALRRGKRACSDEQSQQEQQNRAPRSRTAPSLDGLKDGGRHGLGDSGGGV